MKNPAPLQLQRISVFMPQRLRDDEIRQLFIMRQDVFQTLLDSIKAERGDSIPQHHLIIGQRGMGKTTLLKRLDVELRGTALSQIYIPFTFPEEQYNIDRLSKFWLNSLDALADTLQSEGDEKTAFQLDEQIVTLSAIRNEQELSQKAYETLRESAKTLGRRPVFLLDNLNLIFDRLGEVEQSKLRKVITEPGAPIFIGASPEAFDEDLQYDAPFYDAFAVHFLYKLDFPQTLTMLRHLAEITDQRTLLSQLTADNMPRLETLHMLTGGNVRTVVILFSLVAQGFSADVFQDLEALIDQMTPLYKSRFEELSPQAQVVVDAVALNWDPCKLETLRERTSLENNQLSVQLDRLGKAGWVNKLGKRKAANYEISERFFNIWYLMRRATRRQRRDLLWLTRFLQAWFTRPELVQQAKQFMRNVHEREKEYELAYGLALARALPNQIGEQLKEKIYQRLLKMVDGDVERLEEMVGVNMEEVSEDIIQNYNVSESDDFWRQGIIAQISDDWENAKQKYLKAIAINENSYKAWRGLGSVLRHITIEEKTYDFEKAEEAYMKAISINYKDDHSWLDLGEMWERQTNNLEKSEKAYREVIKIRPLYYYGWLVLGDLLCKKKNYNEAKVCYLRSIECYTNNARTWTKLAEVELKLSGNAEYVEAHYIRAIGVDKQDCMTRLEYGWFLKSQGRLDEAETVFIKATKMKNADSFIYWNVGRFMFQTNRYEKAEFFYKRGLGIEADNYLCLDGLAEINHYHSHDYEIAKDYYVKAIEKGVDNPYVKYTKNNFVYLLRDKVGDVKEAKEIYQTVKIEIPNTAALLHKATFAEIDKDFEEATECWLQAINLFNDSITERRDFYISMGLSVKYNFNDQLLKIFELEGNDRVFRPFYEAMKAINLNSEDYLRTEVAAEVREVAMKVFKYIGDYTE